MVETSITSFAGVWEAPPFGRLVLARNKEAEAELCGQFDSGGAFTAGTLEATERGSRLDFIWRDTKGVSGWGFLRRSQGSLLAVGMWGYGADKLNGQALVATRLLTQEATDRRASEVKAGSESEREQSLRFQGYDLVVQGRWLEAIEPLETALVLLRSQEYSLTTSEATLDSVLINEAGVLIRLLACYLALGDLGSVVSIAKSHQVARQQQHIYGKLLDHLGNAVTVWHKLQHYGGVAITIRELADRLEQWRARLRNELEKIAALDEAQAVFQKLVAVLLDLGDGEQALLASEAARARAMADVLETRRHNLKPGPDDAGSIPQLTSDSGTSEWYFAPILALPDLRALVAGNRSTFIEYFLLEHSVAVWIVSPTGGITTIRLKVSRQDIDVLVQEFVTLAGMQSSIDDADGYQLWMQRAARIKGILRELHRHLVEPIPGQILPAAPDEVLTIVPHGSLFQIPFAALLDSAGDYIVEWHTLAYLPSIAVLRYTQANQQRVASSGAPTLLAFVNPQPTSVPLKPLEITEAEVSVLSALYPEPSKNLLICGSDATREALLHKAPGACVLYLAAHAEAKADPADSYLALAKSGTDEGFVRLSDVAAMQIGAELVVLAACETARGAITGDGVAGFSRAFIVAGAPTLMASLWKVSEEITLEQMFSFHQSWLKRGTSKALALREAQLEAMWNLATRKGEKGPPYLWAGFVVVGEWS